MDDEKILQEAEDPQAAEQPATGGSVAYDLSRFDTRARVREAVLEAPAERREQVQRETRPRQRLSFSVILMLALIAGMAALLIYNYMTLTVMTDELSTKARELEDLKNEEVILQKQYEERYILSDIETYAVEQLGMVKLENSMMEYIELSNPDTITIIDPYEENRAAGFFHTLGDRIRDLLAFLT